MAVTPSAWTATLADLRFFDAAREDLPEIDRLVAILNDDARTDHWKEQKRRIESAPKSLETSGDGVAGRKNPD